MFMAMCTTHPPTSVSVHHTQSHQLSCLDKEASFQRSSDRLNGLFLLDALGEDSPEGGSNRLEGLLAVSLVAELYCCMDVIV